MPKSLKNLRSEKLKSQLITVRSQKYSGRLVVTPLYRGLLSTLMVRVFVVINSSDHIGQFNSGSLISRPAIKMTSKIYRIFNNSIVIYSCEE